MMACGLFIHQQAERRPADRQQQKETAMTLHDDATAKTEFSRLIDTLTETMTEEQKRSLERLISKFVANMDRWRAAPAPTEAEVHGHLQDVGDLLLNEPDEQVRAAFARSLAEVMAGKIED
jgi:hypothetical protein